MPSTVRKHHAPSKQHPSHQEAAAQKKLIREQRLDTYTKEPITDGNRLVMLPHQLLASDTSISRDAEAKMAVKIVDLMEPFDTDTATWPLYSSNQSRGYRFTDYTG